MEQVTIGGVKVSRLVIGGNPFSGFSHHSAEMDRRMRQYFTTARIKATLEEAESLGINTLIARTDSHIIRTLAEYWDEGGRIQWFAQTATELRSTELAVQRAVANGARGCYVHGGETDFLRAQGRFDEIQPAIDMIRQGVLRPVSPGTSRKSSSWLRRPSTSTSTCAATTTPPRATTTRSTSPELPSVSAKRIGGP